VSYYVDRGHERPLVSFRRLVEAADLPDELQRSSTNLLVGSWGIEVEQGSNVSAHSQSLRLSSRNKNVQFYNIPYDRVIRLTQIVADDLQNDEVSSLIEYMTAMSSGQATQHKKIIVVTGLTNKKIKFLLRKFLYTRHLPDYGVLDTAGNFEIVHLKPEKKQSEQHETLSPTMDVRFPVVIPHWVQPSNMIEWQGQAPPKTKRLKRK
jgi:hypothetical protein